MILFQFFLNYKKHIDANVKERPQTLLVPSEVRDRTTNGEIGPVLIKFTKFGIVRFLSQSHEYLEESPNCAYIPDIHCL